MRERILTGWTFMRFFYLLMGIMIIIQSAIMKQWFGIAFGGYFAAMGLFSFGCASGNCFGGTCVTNVKTENKEKLEDITYEEIK